MTEGHPDYHSDGQGYFWGALPIKHTDITQPPHYTHRPTECIDAIREMLGGDEFIAYCRGNVLKYTWRALRKDSLENNMLKAQWYASWAAGRDPRESGGEEVKEAVVDEPRAGS